MGKKYKYDKIFQWVSFNLHKNLEDYYRELFICLIL